MDSAMDSGVRPPMSSPTGARNRPRSCAASAPRSAQQLFAPRRGSQQADVGHAARGERAQVVQIRVQVVAHDNGGGKVVERDGVGDVGGARFDELGRGRKALRNEIGGAMIHHRDAPAEESRERGDRARVRPAA